MTLKTMATCAVALAGMTAAAAGCGDSSSGAKRQAASKAATKQMQGTSTKATAGMPKTVRIRPLGTAVWQHMQISARTSAPATFAVPAGDHDRLAKPAKGDTNHLMVMLTDAGTHVQIPYATVWATIRHNGKIVYDERLWPMISRYMGSHYGNNIALPVAGKYDLSLLISPPRSARHMEYSNLWQHPHRVELHFFWKPGS